MSSYTCLGKMLNRNLIALSVVGCFLCLEAVRAQTPDNTNDNSLTIVLGNPSPHLSVGDTARFTCQTPGGPPEGSPQPSNRYQFWKGDVIVATTFEPSYVMKDVKLSDAGEYWCSLVSDEGKWKSTNTIAINVTRRFTSTNRSDKPSAYRPTTMTTISSLAEAPTLVLHRPLAFFYEGSGIRFTCEQPPHPGFDASYELRKDGERVMSHREKDFVLYNVKQSDTGHYTCALLLVYRKVDSHNSVFVEIREHPDADKEQDYYYYSATTATATPPTTFIILLTSLVPAMNGIKDWYRLQ